jgi:hypothetical protein
MSRSLGRRRTSLYVLGGDGTILNVVSGLGEIITRSLESYIGSLGFLTCLNSSAYQEAVQSIVSGKFCAQRARPFRTSKSRATEKAGQRTHALTMPSSASAAKSRVSFASAPAINWRAADRVQTPVGWSLRPPTGSTAYSAFSGGPILEPQSGSSSSRRSVRMCSPIGSVIVGDDSVIEVEPSEPDYPIYLTLEWASSGGTGIWPNSVVIRRAEKVLPSPYCQSYHSLASLGKN